LYTSQEKPCSFLCTKCRKTVTIWGRGNTLFEGRENRMTKNKILAVLADVVTALVLFLFIVSFSVTVTLNFRPLYYMDIDLLAIEERSGIPKDEIIENYDVLIDYNSMFSDAELVFPTLAMSETGRIHFEEVKVIFVLFQRMALLGGLAGAVLVALHMRKRSYRFWKLTGIFTLLIPAVLGAAMAVNWDKAFVVFHKIAFDNDYWIFDARTDPVITILPDTFFLHCAAMILVLIVVGSLLSFAIYKNLKKKAGNE